jgi:periplasmic divalent cation tolerance protein
MSLPPGAVVLVTAPSRAAGRRLAEALVRQRLAACVNLVPGVESVFRWAGRVDRCREVLLVMKTPLRRYRELQAAVRRLHPYRVPEVLALRAAAGLRSYVSWVAASTQAPRRRGRRAA